MATTTAPPAPSLDATLARVLESVAVLSRVRARECAEELQPGVVQARRWAAEAADALRGSAVAEADLAAAARLAALARERCHIELHHGPWHAVGDRLREAHALASAAVAVAAARAGDLALALRVADRAVILGGPKLMPAGMFPLIDGLHSILVARRGDADAALAARLSTAFLPSGGVPRAATPSTAPVPVLEGQSSSSVWSAFVASAWWPRQPVVLRGLAAKWPALRTWADGARWLRLLGERTVPVELGAHYMDPRWRQRLMPFRGFVSRLLESGGAAARPYLAQHPLLEEVPALRADVRLPVLAAGAVDARGAEDGDRRALSAATAPIDTPLSFPPEGAPTTTLIWMGPAGTRTCLHTDPYPNLYTQVAGHKRFLLAAPGHAAALAPHPAPLDNTSTLDVGSLSAVERLAAAGVEWLEAVLGPGDVLFLPRGWWHYVEALAPSVSLSCWWDDQDATG